MSSIFSDPGWSRGRTLLSGETIDLDGSGNPIAGSEIVGQVKVFQDVNPLTGARNSNRLVYCVAARYTGSSTLVAADNAGKVFAFTTGKPLSEFSAVATATNVTDGRSIGVLDEYLSMPVRQYDIVWLVVKGPTSIQSSGTAIAAGAAIEVTSTAGRILTKNTGVTIANQIANDSVGGTAGALVRSNLHSDEV
jgi:hypothetical protein